MWKRLYRRDQPFIARGDGMQVFHHALAELFVHHLRASEAPTLATMREGHQKLLALKLVLDELRTDPAGSRPQRGAYSWLLPHMMPDAAEMLRKIPTQEGNKKPTPEYASCVSLADRCRSCVVGPALLDVFDSACVRKLSAFSPYLDNEVINEQPKVRIEISQNERAPLLDEKGNPAESEPIERLSLEAFTEQYFRQPDHAAHLARYNALAFRTLLSSENVHWVIGAVPGDAKADMNTPPIHTSFNVFAYHNNALKLRAEPELKQEVFEQFPATIVGPMASVCCVLVFLRSHTDCWCRAKPGTSRAQDAGLEQTR